MTDEDGGEDRDERRAKLGNFAEAVRAFRERPADAEHARRVLSFPLEREAWEGLGEAADERLAEMTPSVGDVLRTFGRHEEALGWYDAALDPSEIMTAATQEGSPVWVTAMARLIEIILGMGATRVALPRADPRTEAGPVCLERASLMAGDLAMQHREYEPLLAVTLRHLGMTYVFRGEEAEASSYLHPLVGLLESKVEAGETRGPSGIDFRLELVWGLGGLGRDEEALGVFDRAAAEDQKDTEGRFDARRYSSVAADLTNLRRRQNASTEASRWAERWASVHAPLVGHTPHDTQAAGIAFLALASLLLESERFDETIDAGSRAAALFAELEGWEARACEGRALVQIADSFVARIEADLSRGPADIALSFDDLAVKLAEPLRFFEGAAAALDAASDDMPDMAEAWASTLLAMTSLHLACGRWDEALGWYREVLDSYEEGRSAITPRQRAMAHLGSAAPLRELGRTEEALAAARAAEALCEGSDADELLEEIRVAIAEIEGELGRVLH